MNALLEKVRNEPVLVVTLVTACLALLVSFGVTLSEAQTGAVVALVIAVLGFVARSKVTPNRKL